MKNRWTEIALAVSLVINIIGIWLLSSSVGISDEVKRMSQEESLLNERLSYARTSNIVTQLNSDNVAKFSFISQFDGRTDFFAEAPVALPAHTKSVTLFVYLHSMGQTCLEPFTKHNGASFADAILSKNHSYVVVAPNYRAPAGWVSEGALADISQNIRMVCEQYSVNKIYLIGNSMGGCAVLTYAAMAPKEIKDKLAGVISVEGCGDLTALYNKTDQPNVRAALEQCFGGSPEHNSVAYLGKSMLPNISSLPGQLRFAIVSARQDHIVQPEFQDAIFNSLKAQGRPATLVPVDQDHGWPPPGTMQKALDFILAGPVTGKKNPAR